MKHLSLMLNFKKVPSLIVANFSTDSKKKVVKKKKKCCCTKTSFN